ncbi:hypothetical protein [Mycobacterium malmoense]|uniref:hypothetical protein n=1 Tax=Mycobacterium malmoense TaxID=1780 RepID=UPI00111C71AE|nr:hypothetical protein [Mycobacterium malmoense]UNB94812.1 hypothetical protein H5T25_02055 [Mycobacterium malmoense]
MDLPARPHITAGIALASAAVIAAGPVAQHLPNLHLAQHLAEASVADIRLADAASGMVDLFAGVENELASLAGGANAAAVPASFLSDVVNPYVSTIEAAWANIQTIGNDWLANPFPVLSQVLTNQANYANILIPDVTKFLQAEFSYLTTGMVPAFQNAAYMFFNGQAATAMTKLTASLYSGFFITPGFNLFSALALPGDMATNFTNVVKTLTSSTVLLANVGSLFRPFLQAVNAFGIAAQDFEDATTPAAALEAIAQAPAVVANGFLNGAANNFAGYPGIFGVPTRTTNAGTVYDWLISLPQSVATSLGAKAGTNTFANLPTVFNGVFNTLSTNLGNFANSIGSGLTSILQGIPSALANLPSMVGALATQIGSWITTLLKLL